MAKLLNRVILKRIYREDMMAETIVELIQESKDPAVTLTEPEEARLKECERIIKKNLNTFLKVGHALAEIRDNRLYRKTHKSFEKYCREVWDLGKGTAHRKICGYQVVDLLESKMSAIADTLQTDSVNLLKPKRVARATPFEPENKKIILPTNEIQARKLTRLKKPDDQVKAWMLVLDQVNAGKKLTAALVNRAVKQVRGEVVKRKIDKTKKQLESTQLVSTLFKRQIKILSEIINDERNSGWKTTSKREAVKWLQNMIELVTEED